MMKYKSTSIKSKWTKTKWLLQHPVLSKHIPSTMQFNKQHLESMLSAYSTVYFKPTTGSGGARIIRIKRNASGYQTQYNTVKENHSTLDHLYDHLNRFSKRRSFLLQKGIHLAKTNGKPFDIRVMVQKTNSGKWESTGVFMKIANSGKIVTNYNQGGRIGYFRPALSGAGFDTTSINNIEAELKRMGVSVGKHFDRYLKGFKELGLDVALDSKRKLWILEVNTRPQIYPLLNLKDRKLYQRVLSYGKQYGRKK
ncbi:YheC/YheD family protein [Paenibacillus sp. J23TS9]|uniref:YheC/YheD family protein n=1 Tax=Paenibacillus sp. J23TS9 TaxID=2807193 RepID=UPI001FD4066D|nr:YheC/YheD family protein [Paenibacillus sp. J23TS9]